MYVYPFEDMVEVWTLFFPIGFYLCWKGIKKRLLFFFVIGALLGLCLEGFQILIKGRVPEITDVLNAGLGCLFGAYLYRSSRKSLLCS